MSPVPETPQLLENQDGWSLYNVDDQQYMVSQSQRKQFHRGESGWWHQIQERGPGNSLLDWAIQRSLGTEEGTRWCSDVGSGLDFLYHAKSSRLLPFSPGMSGWESSLKNLISLRTFVEHKRNDSQAHSPRSAVCGACVVSIAYLWWRQRGVQQAGLWCWVPNDSDVTWMVRWLTFPLILGAWDVNDTLGHPRGCLWEVWLCSDKLLQTTSPSPSPSPCVSGCLCFPCENPCLFLASFLPSIPFYLPSFHPSAFSPSSFSPFSQLSPSPVSFASSGLFLWVFFFVFSWDLAGRGPPKALRFFLLNCGLESKSPLSPSQGLRVISPPVVAQRIS